MELLLLIVIFLLLALSGSLFMCGWYTITRGEVVAEKEDGTFLKKGKIFRDWHFFWTQDTEGKPFNVNRSTGYRFPEIVRSPLSECVTCYSSIYGTLYFWIVGKAFLEIAGIDYDFNWYIVIIWMVYCITCAALNNIIIKKVL